MFPDVRFYDYTKIYKRALKWARGEYPKNYHITYSLNEDNKKEAFNILKKGGNISAVFRNKKLIYGEKKLQNKFFYVNFQMVSASKRKEFVRKYFFLVDNKVVVMTIVSFHKPRKSTYSSFESFIKKLSKLSS